MTKEEVFLRVLEMESQESKGIFENVPLFSQDTAEGCLWQIGKHRKQAVHEHGYMHVCLRLWKYDHVKRMFHFKKF